MTSSARRARAVKLRKPKMLPLRRCPLTLSSFRVVANGDPWVFQVVPTARFCIAFKAWFKQWLVTEKHQNRNHKRQSGRYDC
jgi:hypothetical protein